VSSTCFELHEFIIRKTVYTCSFFGMSSSSSSSSSSICDGVGPLVDPVPVSRIQKSLQRSAMIPSASWGIVFHYRGVIYYKSFCLHAVSSFSCIPVICPKFVLFLIPLQFVYLFCNLSKWYAFHAFMYYGLPDDVNVVFEACRRRKKSK
jgi:hypothetical protein